MKRIAFYLLFISLIAATPWRANAQEFDIKFVELTESQIIVYYDLIDTVKSRTYSVFVYSSQDNFLAPLKEITGDAGLEVKPGMNRKIVWNSKQELGPTFSGDVELEIRGRLYVPFIRFVGIEDVPTRKRKTPFIVKWTGGTRQNILNFQLYKDEKLVHTFPNAPNEQQYQLEIPNSVKPGDGFYFKISDSKNKDQVVITPKFNIRRKIPLALKAVPIVVIGTVVYFVATGGPKPLPGPPGEPSNP